jgi:hypothetical protein
MTVFFGHQSVGDNIIGGINELKNVSYSDEFRIMELKSKLDIVRPVFAHAFIGKNTDPKSKIDDFTNLLKSGIADSIDIAFMKFCYVDFNKKTQVDELFEYYQIRTDSLQRRFPNLKIIHWTVPLTIKPNGIKGLAKGILGMDDNEYRNRFNKLIRKHYIAVEIFDIAELESRFSNGALNKSIFGVPCLIHEYTTDGRHLNENGSAFIAYQLLKMLSLETNN